MTGTKVHGESPSLGLSQALYCLPTEQGGEDALLPEGALLRDLWRGEEHGGLGFSWRLSASMDGGATWAVFETMWDEGDWFPVELKL